jgi:hypothetical protein
MSIVINLQRIRAVKRPILFIKLGEQFLSRRACLILRITLKKCMRSGFVFRLLRYYLSVRTFVAFNKKFSFVILIMHRSGSYYILKEICQKDRLFPYLPTSR